MTTLTVTATQGGSTSNGMALRVMVLTQAAATQDGGTASADNNQQATVTTTQVGSRPYGACVLGPNTSLTANGSTTLIDNINDATNNERYGTFKATATTSSPGATSIGATNGGGGGAAVLEVLQAGTLTEDASAPAVASTTGAHTVTTASFTPPAGSLLVALVSSDGGAAVTTMTVSDTGGGLTWTEQVKANASGSDYAGVWTAQVPGGGGAAAPVPPGRAAPGQTWRRYFQHPQQPQPLGYQSLSDSGSSISGGGSLAAGFGGVTFVQPIVPGPAQPGRTWRRYFQHRQQQPSGPPGPPSFTVASGFGGGGSLTPGTGSKNARGSSAITGTGMVAGTAPKILQQVSGTSTYDYGLSTVAMTTTAGSTLIVLAGWDLSTSTTSASMPAVYVTDDAGNYWYHAGTSSSGVSGSRTGTWVCVNSRPISWLSVSLTTFASSLAYTVIEVANMPAYFSPDVSAANAVASATSLTIGPGSAVSNDIGFSVLVAGTSGLTAPSTPAGWSALTAVTSGAGSPNPVSIFPFWNSALDSGTSANITYTVGQAVPLSGVTFGISVNPPIPLQPNPEFPRLKVEAAFGYTPGDPSQAPASWTDITARAISKTGDSYISSTMGHQYELAQMEAGELTIAIDNHDGAFTPGNTASVFYPDVILGVPVRVSAYWAGHWYYAGAGWVERWPQEWPDLPQWGMSKMIATDAVATMSAASMVSALASDILIDAPYVFIPGSEQYTTLVGGLNPVLIPADAQGLLAANDSRSNQRTGVYVDGTAATNDTGAATNLLGDSDTGFGTTSISTPPTQPSSGPGVIYTDPGLPSPLSANGVSVEFWLIIPAAAAANEQPLVFSAYGPASNYGTGKPSLSVRINSFSGATMTITTAAGNTISAPFNPGTAAQQVVLTVTSSSIAVYVNGGLSATASLGASDTSVWDAVSLGCPNYAYQAALGEIGNFTAFNMAIYPYQLAVQRILSHYVTGFSGQQGSDATARMAQILSWANLGIARAGQVLFGDPGVEEDIAQGPAYSLEGQSAADGLNQLVLNESGLAFAAPSGAVQFVHRWALFNQSPAAVFGDSPDSSLGEVPYLPAMSWDYDLTYLDNVVQVTQQVGANNTITVTAADFGSQASYFLRSPLTQTIQTTSDLDAYSLAQWEIAKYSQPELRVAGVTIDAASNPATAFPVVLAIQQGQAVTATRRPAGGAVISQPVLVEKIEHSIGPGKWQTSYQLSPYTPEDAVLQLDEAGFDVLGENTLP